MDRHHSEDQQRPPRRRKRSSYRDCACPPSESDAVTKDDGKNLVVCPLPYDRSFMQVFYQAWEVVVQFLAADAQLPREANLPRPPSRQVARYLEDRRVFSVVQVIEALEPLAQPELLRTEEAAATV